MSVKLVVIVILVFKLGNCFICRKDTLN